MNTNFVGRENDRRKVSRRSPFIKENMDVLYRKYLVARVYVVLSVITTLIVAMFEPNSIYFQHFMQTKFESKFVLGIITMIAVAAIVDLIVNDFMPNKYKIMIFYNKRHLIYMGMSLGMYGMTAAIILTEHSGVVLLRLWLDGFIAAVIAVLDIFARHGKGILWQSGK